MGILLILLAVVGVCYCGTQKPWTGNKKYISEHEEEENLDEQVDPSNSGLLQKL